MKRAVVLLFAASITAVVAFATWRYLSGPRAVAEKWFACHGSEDRSLVTTTDRQYWNEAYPPSYWESLRARLDACGLGASTIEDIAVHGRFGEVKYLARGPIMSWDQMTEFPATSTPAERVAIIRERASHVQPSEMTGTLKLHFEGLKWRVLLKIQLL